MKRKIALILMVCTVVTGVMYSGAICGAEEVTINVDGENITANGCIIDGCTYVPAKALFEKMDMNVNTENNKGVIYAVKGSRKIVIDEKNSTVSVIKNGENTELSTKPRIIDEGVYVSLRDMSEALGAEVVWDPIKKTANVLTDDGETDKSYKENTGSADLSTMTVQGDGITAEENIIKITKAGDYELKGTLADGMIYVNCDGKVKLRLAGVNITNSSGPGIFAENSKKLYITLAEDTENVITDGSEYSEKYDADGAIFSNDDIEIKGSGTLKVTGNYEKGISSDDDVKIENGIITVNAVNGDGIAANDSVKITGGDVGIEALGDGIASKGYVEIKGGKINVTTKGEIPESEKKFGGMRGERPEWNNEMFQTAQDGERPEMNDEIPQMGKWGRRFDKNNDVPQTSQNGERPEMNGEMPQMGRRGERFDKNNEMPQMSQNGERPEMNGEMPKMEEGGGRFDKNNDTPQAAQVEERPEINGEVPPMGRWGERPEINNENTDNSDENSVSSKGIKAETTITVTDGNITVNSTDTCIKGDYIAVEGGTLNLVSSAKKGIKAMGDLFINDGEININSKDEGLETKQVITINGGKISVKADEDGINAGGNTGMGVGRSTEESNRNHSVVINGGEINVSSSNDGIDSNGSIYINGGKVIVNGPVSGGDSAFDTDGEFIINGGFVLGAGSVGMVEAPLDTSSQNVLNIAFEKVHTAGSTVSVKDSDGNVIFSFEPEKSYQSVIFSCENIKSGVSYTAYAEDESISAEVSSVITPIGNVKSSMGGFRH